MVPGRGREVEERKVPGKPRGLFRVGIYKQTGFPIFGNL
jgi:hypothetical protein